MRIQPTGPQLGVQFREQAAPVVRKTSGKRERIRCMVRPEDRPFEVEPGDDSAQLLRRLEFRHRHVTFRQRQIQRKKSRYPVSAPNDAPRRVKNS